MPHFRRKLIGLLLTTGFLLFIAYLAMKMMQNGGKLDLENLRIDAENWVHGLTQKVNDIIAMVRNFFCGITIPSF